MGDFKVVDKTGVWLKSRAIFPIAQPYGHLFAPGLPTKIDLDTWIEGQIEAGVLTKCADPFPPVLSESPPKGLGKIK